MPPNEIILWDEAYHPRIDVRTFRGLDVGVVAVKRGRTRSEVVLAGNLRAFLLPLGASTKLNPSFCGPGQHRPNGPRTLQTPGGERPPCCTIGAGKGAGSCSKVAPRDRPFPHGTAPDFFASRPKHFKGTRSAGIGMRFRTNPVGDTRLMGWPREKSRIPLNSPRRERLRRRGTPGAASAVPSLRLGRVSWCRAIPVRSRPIKGVEEWSS